LTSHKSKPSVITLRSGCEVLLIPGSFGGLPQFLSLFSVLVIFIVAIRTPVAQLVKALRYKPEGRGFDFRWYRWNFSLT
jgi:hypothetical protein